MLGLVFSLALRLLLCQMTGLDEKSSRTPFHPVILNIRS